MIWLIIVVALLSGSLGFVVGYEWCAERVLRATEELTNDL
jgi:hypothetical protein